MPVEMEYDGSLYRFERFNDGEGRWVCLRGKCIGTTQIANGTGTIVPLLYGYDLTTAAVERKIAAREDLCRFIPAPPEPEKTPREKRDPVAKARKDGRVVGGFNLFAALGGS